VIYCGVAFVAAILTFQLFKISKPMSRYFSAHDAVEVAKACAISVAIAGALLFTFTRMEETPRSIPLIHFFVLAAGLIGGRSIARIRRGHRDKRKPDILAEPIKNIVVVGTSRLAWFYTKLVEEFAADESQVVALLDERPKFQFRSLNGHPIAGSPLHVAKIFDEYATHGVEIHEIVVACPPEHLSSAAWTELNRISRERSVTLEILPERLFLSHPSKPDLEAQPNDSRDVPAQSINHPVRTSKRLLDLLFVIVVMVAIAPIAVIVALLVLIDVGYPAVFWGSSASVASVDRCTSTNSARCEPLSTERAGRSRNRNACLRSDGSCEQRGSMKFRSSGTSCRGGCPWSVRVRCCRSINQGPSARASRSAPGSPASLK
jgi:hypothetical protein